MKELSSGTRAAVYRVHVVHHIKNHLCTQTPCSPRSCQETSWCCSHCAGNFPCQREMSWVRGTKRRILPSDGQRCPGPNPSIFVASQRGDSVIPLARVRCHALAETFILCRQVDRDFIHPRAGLRGQVGLRVMQQQQIAGEKTSRL